MKNMGSDDINTKYMCGKKKRKKSQRNTEQTIDVGHNIKEKDETETYYKRKQVRFCTRDVYSTSTKE